MSKPLPTQAQLYEKYYKLGLKKLPKELRERVILSQTKEFKDSEVREFIQSVADVAETEFDKVSLGGKHPPILS